MRGNVGYSYQNHHSAIGFKKEVNSHEFSSILSKRGITHFVFLPFEWKFSGFVLHEKPLSSAPDVALCSNGDFYMNSTLRILGFWIKALH